MGGYDIPFVRLVEHFRALHELGLVVSKSVEFIREWGRRGCKGGSGGEVEEGAVVVRRKACGYGCFRKHACLSNIHVVGGGGGDGGVMRVKREEDEFVTRSLSLIGGGGSSVGEVDGFRECVSLPRDFSVVCGGDVRGGRGSGGRRVLVRQDAFDFGSNDSVDSGLGERGGSGDGEMYCSEACLDVREVGGRGTFINELYACWWLNLGVGEE